MSTLRISNIICREKHVTTSIHFTSTVITSTVQLLQPSLLQLYNYFNRHYFNCTNTSTVITSTVQLLQPSLLQLYNYFNRHYFNCTIISTVITSTVITSTVITSNAITSTVITSTVITSTPLAYCSPCGRVKVILSHLPAVLC